MLFRYGVSVPTFRLHHQISPITPHYCNVIGPRGQWGDGRGRNSVYEKRRRRRRGRPGGAWCLCVIPDLMIIQLYVALFPSTIAGDMNYAVA
ncbi:hypothetical protein EVAR_65651_1 [Eumeta japonica]|uniref:Uncharacterized protein n=1 Tax=Eumeta variegata TaxID=151549 RepID=A0A4C1Z8U7_EUMVA|nr:hypothetical protein EVAR_65651_1 [Eumeta japonica]